MNNTVTFTKQTFESLKQCYNKASKNNEEVFYFQGNQILTQYAKYLIEYLTPNFK